MLSRDRFTARGFIAFSPWNQTGYTKSLIQINMGQSAMGFMDVINPGVLSNFSRSEFTFGSGYDTRYHMEKQPQFTEEVASDAFPSVNEGNSYPENVKFDLLNSPTFSLPPHQTGSGEFILILDYLGTYKYKI